MFNDFIDENQTDNLKSRMKELADIDEGVLSNAKAGVQAFGQAVKSGYNQATGQPYKPLEDIQADYDKKRGVNQPQSKQQPKQEDADPNKVMGQYMNRMFNLFQKYPKLQENLAMKQIYRILKGINDTQQKQKEATVTPAPQNQQKQLQAPAKQSQVVPSGQKLNKMKNITPR